MGGGGEGAEVELEDGTDAVDGENPFAVGDGAGDGVIGSVGVGGGGDECREGGEGEAERVHCHVPVCSFGLRAAEYIKMVKGKEGGFERKKGEGIDGKD